MPIDYNPVVRLYKASTNNRQDSGNFNSFDLDLLEEINSDNESSVYTITIRTRFEGLFTPGPSPPITYNSKEVTGMVGLENLGATCYLNALLQVCYIYS